MISKANFDQAFSVKGETPRERATEMLNKWKRFNIQMEEICKDLSHEHPKNKLMRIHRKEFYAKLANTLEKYLNEDESALDSRLRGMLIGVNILSETEPYNDTFGMAEIELSRILGLEFEVRYSDGTIITER